MAPTDDLLHLAATTTHDFYTLLSVDETTPADQLRRAYRRTALRYHPDKNPDNPAAVDTFHLLELGYAILSDAAAKSAYDAARRAREGQRLREEAMDRGRRDMLNELVRAEAAAAAELGQKRKVAEEDAAAERELRAFAEEAKRRKMEVAAKKEREREAARREGEVAERVEEWRRTHLGGLNVPDAERTVKVRWVRAGRGLRLGKDELRERFARFQKTAEIDHLFVGEDKKQRIGDGEQKAKVRLGQGFIVFQSVLDADLAVSDGQDDLFISVAWLSGPPDLDAPEVTPSFAESAQTSSGRSYLSSEEKLRLQMRRTQRARGPDPPTEPGEPKKSFVFKKPTSDKPPAKDDTPPANGTAHGESKLSDPAKPVPKFSFGVKKSTEEKGGDKPVPKFSFGGVKETEDEKKSRLRKEERQREEERIRREDEMEDTHMTTEAA